MGFHVGNSGRPDQNNAGRDRQTHLLDLASAIRDRISVKRRVSSQAIAVFHCEHARVLIGYNWLWTDKQ